MPTRSGSSARSSRATAREPGSGSRSHASSPVCSAAASRSTSTLGEGSTFSLHLPVSPAVAGPRRWRVGARLSRIAACLRSRRRSVEIPARRGPVRAVLVALRPRQWTKNLLLFAGIVFAAQIDDPGRWLAAAVAFVAWCLASSAAYLVNDVRDAAADRLAPGQAAPPESRVASSRLGGARACRRAHRDRRSRSSRRSAPARSPASSPSSSPSWRTRSG